MDFTSTDSAEPICHITPSLEQRFATTEFPSSKSEQCKLNGLCLFSYPHRPIDRGCCSILVVRSV